MRRMRTKPLLKQCIGLIRQSSFYCRVLQMYTILFSQSKIFRYKILQKTKFQLFS